MKSEELVKEYFKILGGIYHENPMIYKGTQKWEEAKKCALINVNSIIKELERTEFNYDLEHNFKDVCLGKTVIPYYVEMKKEIENL